MSEFERPTESFGTPTSPASPDSAPIPSLPPSTPQISAVPANSGWEGVRSFLRETLETIALTLVIFLLIRAGVQNFRIEGQSMEPNFHEGQYLLVSKVDYLLHPPERGDVVVFLAPQNTDKDFIKRVIGLPGETVEVREGRVVINGKELPTNYLVNPGSYTYGPVRVGDGELFVLGDNRNYSSDSHSWGMLPREHLIGKAWVSYWPPQQWGVIQSPSFADFVPPTPTAMPAYQPPAALPSAVPQASPVPSYP